MKNETPAILIVDDDERNIFALKAVLSAKGFTCCTATSGHQALKLLLEGNPVDLVLVDMMMPEMDGYEFMREVRSQHSLERITLVAVTAQAMSGDREKCISAGADGYLSKPVDTDRLMQLIVDCQSGAE